MSAPFSFGDITPMRLACDQWRLNSSGVGQREIEVRGNALREAGEALSGQYTELLGAFERLQQVHDLADREIGHMHAYLSVEEGDEIARHIAYAIREDHGRSHASGWAVCEHRLCREAQRWIA